MNWTIECEEALTGEIAEKVTVEEATVGATVQRLVDKYDGHSITVMPEELAEELAEDDQEDFDFDEFEDEEEDGEDEE